MEQQNSYSFEELLECGHGRLFGPGNAQLPLPPMLMFDRITHIAADGGEYGKGSVVAELDINPDLWFFKCHFENDPVMPGCLGLDAMWQLVGFFLGEVKFTGQVLDSVKNVTYHIDLKRVIIRKLVMGIADGVMKADGETIYEVKDMKVGLFQQAEASR